MSRTHKILIIEDNEINREIIQEILEGQYELFFAVNGKEGMEMLHKHYSEISVVLLDIQMPVMNGFEVLAAKAADPLLKDIPVIVTTDSEDEVECLQRGAQDFVHKPYNPVVMRLRVESIINLSESTEANRQKTMFIQGISHEIRTPLNAIMGFAQLLEDMGDSFSREETSTFCHSINVNSYELMSMVDNMVALSNFDSGLLIVNYKDVPLNQICNEAMERAAFSGKDGVRTYFTSDVEDSFQLHTDPKLIRKAVFNYIVNANKFTSEGEIHLHCSGNEKPGHVIISVTDTGCGVPQDKAAYIFERFTKIDSFIPGMGLGLTIAKKVAEVLGGSAYLDTTYIGGSRFVLELPVGA